MTLTTPQRRLLGPRPGGQPPSLHNPGPPRAARGRQADHVDHRQGQRCGLPPPVHHPVEPSGETTGNRSPGPPTGRVPPHQRGNSHPDAAPHGSGEGRAEDGAGPEASPGHRRHAQLRGQLVVGLPPEPESAPEGYPSPGADVRLRSSCVEDLPVTRMSLCDNGEPRTPSTGWTSFRDGQQLSTRSCLYSSVPHWA